MDYTNREFKIFLCTQSELTLSWKVRKTLREKKYTGEKHNTSAWAFPECYSSNLIRSNAENKREMQQLKSGHKHSVLLGNRHIHSSKLHSKQTLHRSKGTNLHFRLKSYYHICIYYIDAIKKRRYTMLKFWNVTWASLLSKTGFLAFVLKLELPIHNLQYKASDVSAPVRNELAISKDSADQLVA